MKKFNIGHLQYILPRDLNNSMRKTGKIGVSPTREEQVGAYNMFQSGFETALIMMEAYDKSLVQKIVDRVDAEGVPIYAGNQTYFPLGNSVFGLNDPYSDK